MKKQISKHMTKFAIRLWAKSSSNILGAIQNNDLSLYFEVYVTMRVLIEDVGGSESIKLK